MGLAHVPVLAALAVAMLRYRRVMPVGPLAGRRRAAFAAGMAFATVALVGPLDEFGRTQLLSAHMVQVVLLLSVVPALVIYGLPPAVLQRRLAWAGRWTSRPGPAVGVLAVAVAVVWGLHVPAVFDAVTPRPGLDVLSHLVLLAAGFALTLPLSGPLAIQGFGAVVYLVLAEVGIGVLGIWLAWYPELVYAVYAGAQPTFGLARETDQALAGAILLVAEEPLLGAECAILFIAALGRADREAELDDARP